MASRARSHVARCRLGWLASPLSKLNNFAVRTQGVNYDYPILCHKHR